MSAPISEKFIVFAEPRVAIYEEEEDYRKVLATLHHFVPREIEIHNHHELKELCFCAIWIACEEAAKDVKGSGPINDTLEKIEIILIRLYILHAAAKEGKKETVIETLIKHNQRLDREDAKGRLPLHLAIKKGHSAIIPQLVPIGSFEPRYYSNKQRMHFCPLSLAVFKGDNACVDQLIQQGYSPSRLIEGVGTLLHFAVDKSKDSSPHLEVLKGLLNKHYKLTKPLLEVRDSQGRTPLALAAAIGNVEALTFLIHKNANPTACDNEGRAPLCLAIIGRHTKACEVLGRTRSCLWAEFPRDKGWKTFLGKDPESELILGMLKHFEHIKTFLQDDEKELKEKRKIFLEIPPEYLVLKGGGLKGIAYIGAIQVLEDIDLLRNLKGVAGSSAGAIMVTLLAFRFRSPEILDFLNGTPIWHFLGIPSKEQAQEFFSDIGKSMRSLLSGSTSFLYNLSLKTILEETFLRNGISDGSNFIAWISATIAIKTAMVVGGDPKQYQWLTFGELNDLIQMGYPFKHLCVIGTKIGKNQDIVYFSSEDPQWKDLIIADTVLASISYPVVFRPHTLHFLHKERPLPGASGIQEPERRYRVEARAFGSFNDGGLLKNLPINAFDTRYHECPWLSYEENAKEKKKPNSRTLALSLHSDEDLKAKENSTVDTGLGVYMNVESTVFGSAFRHSEKHTAKQYGPDYRILSINSLDVKATSFFLAEEKKQALIESGAASAVEFFDLPPSFSRVKRDPFPITCLPFSPAGKKEMRQDMLNEFFIWLSNGNMHAVLQRYEQYKPFFQKQLRSRQFVNELIVSNKKESLQFFKDTGILFPFVWNRSERSLFHTAIVTSALNAFEVLITYRVSAREADLSGNTLLHYIAQYDKTDFYEVLASQKELCASLMNVKNKEKETPLLVAIKNGSLSIAKELMNHPDVDLKEKAGKHTLLCTLLEQGRYHFASYLIDTWKKRAIEEEMIKREREGNMDLLQIQNRYLLETLIEYGIGLTTAQAHTNKTIFYVLAKENQLTLFKKACKRLKKIAPGLYLSTLEQVVYASDGRKKTALMIAAEKNNHEIVEFLICEGVDYSSPVDGVIPLKMAPTFFLRNETYNILYKALCGEIERPFLPTILPNIKVPRRLSPHEIANALRFCCDHGEFAAAQTLIQTQIVLSPFTLRDVRVLKREEEDRFFHIPLEFLTIYDKEGNGPLLIVLKSNAPWEQKRQLIKLLLTGAYRDDVNQEDGMGTTPLMLAAKRCYLAVKILIACEDLDINKQDQNGNTALHYAIKDNFLFFRRLQIIKALLKHEDIQPNLQNKDGQIPIDLLVTELEEEQTEPDEELMELLITKGAEPFWWDTKRNFTRMGADTEIDEKRK